jgi:hypothetical protein
MNVLKKARTLDLATQRTQRFALSMNTVVVEKIDKLKARRTFSG